MVALTSAGGRPVERDRRKRTTVETVTTGGPVLMLASPPRALATKTVAPVGVDATVMPHGPTRFLFLKASTGAPCGSRMIRQPAGSVSGKAPPDDVGRLPTTTHPPGRMARAVSSPMPPGQDRPDGRCEIWEN